MNTIEYRTMEDSDIEPVLAFWGNIDGVHLHSNGEETYDAISSYLKRNPGLSFVAVCGSEIVGAVMCGHDGRRGYLNHLAVRSEYRRSGIAKQLMSKVEDELIRLGIKKEALFVLCDNTSAQEFYEYIGWQEEKIVKVYAKIIKPDNKISIRRFENGDEESVSELIRTTLEVSNANDYSPEFIQENIDSHSPEVIAERAKEGHFYIVTNEADIIGCGGITGYWGSTTESYLLSIFVSPRYQGMGIGRKIMEKLEADEFFDRAWRTEVGSSVTAVGFYLKMGYQFKNGVKEPDEYGVVRLEKRK